MGDLTLIEIFIIIFCIFIALFIIYMAYVCYLKKFKGYRYENGVPDVAILRPSRVGSAGMKHFSAAGFRASQLSISSSDRTKLTRPLSGRPHTFPLTASANVSNLPEIRIDQV